MAFTSWRGTMGLIKPTHRPGSLEETIRLLPEGIGVVPLTVGLKKGNRRDFDEAITAIEEKVAELAAIGVDLIAPAGAPPLMVHGYRGEQALVEKWEQAYGLPVITAGGSQVQAMNALSAKRIVGVTYFKGDINNIFAQYFTEAGFDVLAMEGMDVPFDQVQKLSSREVYAHTKAAFLAHPQADLVYMMGGGWRILDIVEILEQDLQVPVLHSVPARVWSTQQHFRVGQQTSGFGRLLSEMPALV